MHVLIFEQWWGGHYTNYLKYLVPKFAGLASCLTVSVTQRFVRMEEFKDISYRWGNLGNVVLDTSVPDADPSLPWHERVTVLNNLRAKINEHRPDFVFVPSGDAQTLALGLLRPMAFGSLSTSIPSECIVHYGYGPGPMDFKSRLKRLVYRTSFEFSNWRRLNVINFLLYEAMNPRGDRSRIAMVPHPTEKQTPVQMADARREFGLPEDGRLLGFVGLMDHRKAIPELINGFRAAKLSSSDRLVLAGRLDEQFARMISEHHNDLVRAGRLIVINRHLSDLELATGLQALDLVCLPYYQFPGLSSLMLLAIASGRPTLVHDFGWMRAVSRRFGVGRVCNIYEPRSFAAAMEICLDDGGMPTTSGAIASLLSYHSPNNFCAHAVLGLRAVFGAPGTEDRLSWEQVCSGLDAASRKLQ